MENDRNRRAYFLNLLDYKWKSPRNLNKLEVLLSDSSYINGKDKSGRTPLSRVLSGQCFSLDVVRLLINHGADINARDNDGLTPLLAALASKRDDAVIRVLLEGGADATLQDSSGRTPMCYALRKGASIEVLRMILEGGCHPDACRPHGSALYCFERADAFRSDPVPHDAGVLKEGVLDLLIEAGSDVLRFGESEQSPICTAYRVGAGRSDIERLMELGATMNQCHVHPSVWYCVTDFRGETGSVWKRDWKGILDEEMYGRTHGVMPLKADVFELLRKVGPQATIENNMTYSPLLLALNSCIYQIRDIMFLLNPLRVDIDYKDANGCNLLHLAVENSHCKPSVVKCMIERGVKVDELVTRMKLKLTPLRIAVEKCTFSVISFLLKYGSPVNARDRGGYTALDTAVRWKRGFEIIQLLLFAGARSGVKKNPHKFSSLSIALDHFLRDKRRNTLDVFKLLLKYRLLENPKFEMERLLWGYKNVGRKLAEEMKSLANRCADEVQIMKSNNIGINHTLFFYVKRRSFATQIPAANRPLWGNKELNRLLRIMIYNDLSEYFELISNTVGKSTMETRLQELQVYAINNINVRTYLIYDCVCDITEFLSAADLLRLILVYAQENHAARKHDTGGKRRSKRILEQSEKNFQKHQKARRQNIRNQNPVDYAYLRAVINQAQQQGYMYRTFLQSAVIEEDIEFDEGEVMDFADEEVARMEERAANSDSHDASYFFEHPNDSDNVEGKSSIRRSSTRGANTEIQLGENQHQGTSKEGDRILEILVPECPVCKESMETKKIVATECGHLTCVDCMQTILSGRYTRACPKCRKRIGRNTVRLIHP